MHNLLKERKQCEVLMEQVFIWTNINTGVLQSSTFCPLLFLIYINNLTVSLSINAELFADDTSLVSNIHDPLTSANFLNKDLKQNNKHLSFPKENEL